MASAPSEDDLTIYVGEAGEKYSDSADWRELILDRRLSPSTIVPLRRSGALTHARAGEVPELKALFAQISQVEPTPARAAPNLALDGASPAAPPAPTSRADPSSQADPAQAAPSQPDSQASRSAPVKLQRGANATLEAASVTVTLEWRQASPALEVDASAYVLGATGRVQADEDMVFYNQPKALGGAIVMQSPAPGGPGIDFMVELSRLPEAVSRIVFCVSIVDALKRKQTCAQLSPAAISVGGADDEPILSYILDLGGADEAAMILGEIYRRQGGWRFRAVGQGFRGGLGALAGSFGVDVSDE